MACCSTRLLCPQSPDEMLEPDWELSADVWLTTEEEPPLGSTLRARM
jgi:hypothetical protein